MTKKRYSYLWNYNSKRMSVIMGMENLLEVLETYGQERRLEAGEILLQQGSMSDGIYYLKQGWLGVYREEEGERYLLAIIMPGEIVGELGASTGRSRMATVVAGRDSLVIYVSEQDFHRVMIEAPDLAAAIIDVVGTRLEHANVIRVTLGKSYRQAVDRVQDLRSQKDQLEEMLRLREELANMIIHDLRNPLGAISAGLEMLKQIVIEAGKTDEYTTMVIDAMEQGAHRMQRLVNTLMDLACLEEGAMTLSRTALNLQDLVADVLAEEHPLARKVRITLESNVAPNLPPILVDRDVIQRVLVNIVDNAIRFTPADGMVRISVQLAGEMVQVRVTDTGPGIPKEERTRIFEKFTQVQNHTAPRRGSGLGLAFCRMAVEAHGGHIWVEDGPEGMGSCFAFELPVTE
ncbi:MAG TPA: cyclic nucleotide-binding domain-containing protein [Chloroflexi bacterium]|nr:cyclic nucleotide-binding domain-containing protein [Chloroflexota bacterium]